MQLTQPEIIQLLRRRKGLNQADLGVQAFGLTPYSARTKIKNIELGRQVPTPDESRKLAAALDVQMSEIEPSASTSTTASQRSKGNQSIAALSLGISRQALNKRLQKARQ